jgi:formylglycine-generating enzyme required for sulfatase activity
MKMKKQAVLLIVTVVLTNCSFLQANQADINKDGRVDFRDIAIIANNWLWTVQPDGMVWVSIDDPGVVGHEGFTGEMSKYETTNAQYCQFLNAALASGDIDVNTIGEDTVIGASGYNGGADYVDEVYYEIDGADMAGQGDARINYRDGVFSVDIDFEHHPVTYVTWYGAKAFCNYYLYRLPTEWQWEAVADFNGNYTYGCGTSISVSLANYRDSAHPFGTKSVGSYGPFGYDMCDMAGNVWEWTESCLYEDCEPDDRIIRGGGWYTDGNFCTVSHRPGYFPFSGGYSIGFRVCR